MRDRVGWFTVCWYSTHIVVWTTVVLVLDRGIGLTIWDQFRSRAYAEVQGVVTRCGLRRNRKGSQPAVEYEYEVGGKRLRNDCYHYGHGFLQGRGDEAVCERIPAGSRVTVYFDPTSPADSVLQKGLTKLNLLHLLFLVPFNTAVAGMGYYAARILIEKENRYYLWNNIGRRVPVGELSRPARFAIVLLLTSLGLLLVTTLLFGADPPVMFMAVIWGILAGAGILTAAFLWRSR